MRKLARLLGFLLVFSSFSIVCFCPWNGNAGEIQWHDQAPGGFSASIRIPETDVSLLDKILVYVDLTYPHGYRVNPSSLRTHLLFHSSFSEAPFIVESQTVPSEKGNNDLTSLHLIFTLSPQMIGEFPLTFLNISFEPEDPKGKPIELISDIFYITVAAPAAEITEKPVPARLMTFSTEFPIDLEDDNLSLMERDEHQKNAALFAAKSIPWLGILALGMAFAFVFLFKKKQPPLAKRQPRITREQVLQALKESKELLQEGRIHDFYLSLKHHLQNYIEDYFGIKISTETTEEFLSVIAKRAEFSPEMQRDLQKILETVDQVEYGQMETSVDEGQENLRRAQEFISSSN